MKGKFLILISILLLVIAIIFSFIYSEKPETSNLFPEYTQKTATLNSHKLILYVADTDLKREQGLSDISLLPANQGMIFVYTKVDFYQFWMKDMQFSLDFIYLKNNSVVDILQHISPKTYPKAFTSKTPADSIIEVNDNYIENNKIKIGDRLQYVQ